MLDGFYKRFVCDKWGCGVFVKKLGDGWIWYRERAGEIKHACPTCVEQVPEEMRKQPGEKN